MQIKPEIWTHALKIVGCIWNDVNDEVRERVLKAQALDYLVVNRIWDRVMDRIEVKYE